MECPWQFTYHIGIRGGFLAIFGENCKDPWICLRRESHNPCNPVEERFVSMEDKVVDISHNMSLLMEVLERKVMLFGKFGGLNAEIKWDGKLGDNEDPKNKSQKEPEKENPSSSTINLSRYLFKMEAIVNINPFQGDINALKINHLLQQLVVYFNIHYIDEETNISFFHTKVRGSCLNLVGNPYQNTYVGGHICRGPMDMVALL